MSKQKNMPDRLDTEQLNVLFARLEERSETAQSKRIEKVLELLSRLSRGAPDRVQTATSLRRALSRYQWVSRVLPASDGYRVLPFIANRENLSAEDVWEQSAVRDLLDLVPYLGERPRIRRCAEPTCNRWFFAAKREDQKYHSGNCKQRDFDNNPERREKKREAMRKLYADEKARAKRPNNGVGLRSRKK